MVISVLRGSFLRIGLCSSVQDAGCDPGALSLSGSSEFTALGLAGDASGFC